MSSRGYLVDMIESIGEKTAIASHIREKIEAGKDVEKNQQMLKAVLALRRKQMSRLLESAEKADPEYWCDFKHAVKSWVNDSEVYEATLNEKDLELMIGSSEILAMAISCFMGMKFETCARCIFDEFLVKQYEEQHNAKIEVGIKGDIENDDQNYEKDHTESYENE